jgi:hypothetical protein
MKRRAGPFLSIALALVLAGCSAPTTIAYATYDRAPAGFDSSGGLLNGEPSAAWLLGKKSFAIVTFGSSSCPPIPIKLDATPPSAMALTFVPSQNQPCGAEMGATTHQFYLPEGMDVGAPIEVHVVYDFPQHTEYDLVLDPGP